MNLNPNIECRQLRCFAAVADTLSFSRAAKQLHMTQPPLSRNIQMLEKELGFQLFSRTNRLVRLTEPGRTFLEEARKTLVQVDEAAETAHRVRVCSTDGGNFASWLDTFALRKNGIVRSWNVLASSLRKHVFPAGQI